MSSVSFQVKWYSSLFITHNTTVLSNESLHLVVYPWSLSEPGAGSVPSQYYGFGVELIFDNSPASPPPLDQAEQPIGYYYMGERVGMYVMRCSFMRLSRRVHVQFLHHRRVEWHDRRVHWPAACHASRGLCCCTVRIHRLVVCLYQHNCSNNRILSVSEAEWQQAQDLAVGTWDKITGFPTGWGASNSTLTDTIFPAFNAAFYFAAMKFPGTPDDD